MSILTIHSPLHQGSLGDALKLVNITTGGALSGALLQHSRADYSSLPGTSWLQDLHPLPPRPWCRTRAALLFPNARRVHPLSCGPSCFPAAVRRAVQGPTAFSGSGIGWTSDGSSRRSSGSRSPQALPCLCSGTTGSPQALPRSDPLSTLQPIFAAERSAAANPRGASPPGRLLSASGKEKEV